MDRMLGFDSQFLITLGYQLLNVVIITGVLSYFLYEPVKKFLRERQEKIEKQISDAENTEKEAIKLKGEYEQKLSKINVEKSEILEEARKRASQMEAEIIAKAKEEAKKIKDRAMLDIEREEEKARDDMRKQIIELSTSMASRYVETSIDDETQNKLLDEVILGLGEVKWQA